MNSSGIKRGLATTAVSALAVAGIPFIASSASAAPGDSITVASVGPIRNAGDLGGLVVLKTKNVAPGNLALKATNLTGDANSPSQTVSIVGTALVANGAPGDSNKTDGLDEITVELAVTTPSAGDSFAVAIYEDEANPGNVDAGEARATISGTTAGAPTSVIISPDSQTTSAGVPTGNYTATIREADGDLTQLTSAEAFNLTGTGVTFTPDATLDADELQDGTAAFKASSNTPGETTITAAGNGAGQTPATLRDTATINVIANADITADEFDLVTGADTYEKGDAFGGAYEVRVDQGAVTFTFASKDGVDPDSTPDDANKAVVLTLTGTGVTFGGQASRDYTVVLDANGVGSLTVNPEGIQAGDSFTFASPSSNIASTTVQFNRAAADSVTTDKPVYVTKVGDPTSVTVTVLDQYGDPIGAPAQVSITRGPRNGGTTTARQTVDANGKATFSLPDAGVGAGTEDLDVNLFDDQFDGSADTTVAAATINYTADGRGADYNVAGITTNAADTKITPLYDSAAGAGDSATVTITGATAGTPATITVDNGALVLRAGETNLTQGSASDTITLAGGNGSFQVVGTTLGVVNVTIDNAGRTKVYKLTVTREGLTAAQIAATARNVELEGPENVIAGDVATYTATVTDAFDNTVPGVDDSNLNFQVSGPGSLQNKESATDANGELEQTVLLTDNANGSITVRVNGVNSAPVFQFGNAANQYVVANDAPGLSASTDSDSVTSEITNIEELEAAVEAAERDLAESEANLAVAQAELDVAQTQLAIAQAEVDRLKERKQELRKKLNKAKDAGNRQKAKTTRKKLRKAKSDLRDAKAAAVVAQAAVDGQQTVVNLRQTEVDKAEEALAQAKADLEEAQN